MAQETNVNKQIQQICDELSLFKKIDFLGVLHIPYDPTISSKDYGAKGGMPPRRMPTNALSLLSVEDTVEDTDEDTDEDTEEDTDADSKKKNCDEFVKAKINELVEKWSAYTIKKQEIKTKGTPKVNSGIQSLETFIDHVIEALYNSQAETLEDDASKREALEIDKLKKKVGETITKNLRMLEVKPKNGTSDIGPGTSINPLNITIEDLSDLCNELLTTVNGEKGLKATKAEEILNQWQETTEYIQENVRHKALKRGYKLTDNYVKDVLELNTLLEKIVKRGNKKIGDDLYKSLKASLNKIGIEVEQGKLAEDKGAIYIFYKTPSAGLGPPTRTNNFHLSIHIGTMPIGTSLSFDAHSAIHLKGLSAGKLDKTFYANFKPIFFEKLDFAEHNKPENIILLAPIWPSSATRNDAVINVGRPVLKALNEYFLKKQVSSKFSNIQDTLIEKLKSNRGNPDELKGLLTTITSIKEEFNSDSINSLINKECSEYLDDLVRKYSSAQEYIDTLEQINIEYRELKLVTIFMKEKRTTEDNKEALELIGQVLSVVPPAPGLILELEEASTSAAASPAAAPESVIRDYDSWRKGETSAAASPAASTSAAASPAAALGSWRKGETSAAAASTSAAASPAASRAAVRAAAEAARAAAEAAAAEAAAASFSTVPPSQPQKAWRMADDGIYYTRAEFIEYWGKERGAQIWESKSTKQVFSRQRPAAGGRRKKTKNKTKKRKYK